MESPAAEATPPNPALIRARTLLAPPRKRERAGPVLAAAALFAASALGLAAMVITSPAPGFTPVASEEAR